MQVPAGNHWQATACSRWRNMSIMSISMGSHQIILTKLRGSSMCTSSCLCSIIPILKRLAMRRSRRDILDGMTTTRTREPLNWGNTSQLTMCSRRYPTLRVMIVVSLLITSIRLLSKPVPLPDLICLGWVHGISTKQPMKAIGRVMTSPVTSVDISITMTRRPQMLQPLPMSRH